MMNIRPKTRLFFIIFLVTYGVITFVAPVHADTKSANQPSREKIVVIGGGLAGLTAMHELLRRGQNVWLYEADERYGGRIRSGKNPFGRGWFNHGGTFIDSDQRELHRYLTKIGLHNRLFGWEDIPQLKGRQFLQKKNGKDIFFDEDRLLREIFANHGAALRAILVDQQRYRESSSYRARIHRMSLQEYLATRTGSPVVTRLPES